MGPAVHGNNFIISGEKGDLVLKIINGSSVAMYEQQWLPLSIDLII
jgi:hypothetical protein